MGLWGGDIETNAYYAYLEDMTSYNLLFVYMLGSALLTCTLVCPTFMVGDSGKSKILSLISELVKCSI